MLISVCIPHYNRSQYLLAVLDSIKSQEYSPVEVVISDDCSTDDSDTVIPKYIAEASESSQVKFRYIRQQKNLGYDGNLRAALAAAKGEYLFILGNDDSLANNRSLADLEHWIVKLNYPDVCFANFYDHGSPNKIVYRSQSSGTLGSGPAVAARNFRSFSFVGSLAFKKAAFQTHNTGDYDGSIYVQIYLASRTIAAGGMLASIADPLVAKDVKIDGRQANSYIDTLASNNQRIKPNTGGLDQVGRVACDAILPYVSKSSRGSVAALIFGQLLFITYPFWLMTYREHMVYRAAINLALGCWPIVLTRHVRIAFHVKLMLIAIYLTVTPAGLLLPTYLYERLKTTFHRASKSLLRQTGPVPALNQ